MEILGIGVSELLFILLLALILLGPKDMAKAGRTLGTWLRRLVMSDEWRVIRKTTRELSHLPQKLMREANEELGKIEQDLSQQMPDPYAAWSGRPPASVPSPQPPGDESGEHTIQPPAPDDEETTDVPSS
jgi:sec-independent protein translocase protein TatB